MSKNYLTEAFKELDLLESQSFDVDKKGTSELEDFLEDDSLDDFEVVIDPEAETEEDLQKSYMGKVILTCDVCHSMIYKDPAEIVIDEESQLANVGELCPYCFTGDGYKIVGKVAPYEEVTVEAEKPVEVKVDGEKVEVEDKIEEEIQQDQKFPVEHKKAPVMEGNESSKEDRKFLKVTNDEDGTTHFISKKEALDLAKEMGVSSIKELIELQNGRYEDGEVESKFELVSSLKEFREDYRPRIIQLKFLNESKPCYICNWDDHDPMLGDDELPIRFPNMDEDDEDLIFGLTSDKSKAWEFWVEEEANYVKKEAELFFQDVDLDEVKILNIRNKNLKESMDDISITTEDQIIKIKSTPREDKETIQPVTETEIEKAKKAKEDTSVEEVKTQEEVVEEPEEIDVDLDEIDEEGMDDLGESYLKSVYENVNGFKTSKATLQGNKMILEGVISFTSGNKAKTKFIFESKEATKRGKLKFLGENKNISKNKKAFTLIGSLNNKKLMLESLNYNYTGKDSKTGKTKRLYGTIRRKSK